jgi:hypothetical protein
MNLRTDFGLNGYGDTGGRRKTLVVLGAGATRGAQFVTEGNGEPLPPLDKDFFEQVSKMDWHDNISDDAEQLLEFARDEFGVETNLSMEEFFAEVEYTDRFHRDFNVDRGPLVKRYKKALNKFMRVLPKLLIQTTSDRTCKYHETLASKLHTQDCIISFNYDTVIDKALRDNSMKRWDPDKKGYGFEVDEGGSEWRDHSEGKAVKNSIRLLKLHGSINWNISNERVSLVENEKSVKDISGSIIPPTWFKNLEESPFQNIWKKARKEIRTARALVVVGYSVPDTDLFSRSLFKVEAGSKDKREKLDLLVAVNPSPKDRQKFIDMIRGGLESSTRIIELTSMRELSKLLE